MTKALYAAQLYTDIEDVAVVLEEYNQWVGGFYSRTAELNSIEPFGGSVDGLPDGHSLRLLSSSSGKDEVYDLDWSYPSSDDENLRWRNIVRVGHFDGTCLIEHRVLVEALEFIIRPTALAIGSPNVVRRLCKREVIKFGGLSLTAAPYFLSEKNLDTFIGLLNSDIRRLPIVLLTPHANGDNPDIDGDSLASSLAGVAIVVEAVDADTTWEFRAEIGKGLSCFDGGARIYWPGFSRHDAWGHHPLFLRQRILEDPAFARQQIERIIFGVAADRFVSDPRAGSIVDTAAAERRRVNLSADMGKTDWKGLANSYAADLDEANLKIRELETTLLNTKVLFSHSETESPLQPSTEAESKEPNDVTDAVNTAASECKHLQILRSAHESAADCPFRRPSEVQDALDVLNSVSRDWQERRKRGEAGGDIRQMLIARGMGKRCSMHISDTTRAKYKDKYTFMVDGSPTIVEPHITLGAGDPASCASIHFLPPTDKRGIVIAHVGRHLPNTKT